MNQSKSQIKYVLLDSCIIEYLLKPQISPGLTQLILEWVGKDFHLSIMEISYSELVDGVYKKKENQLLEFLNKFPCHNLERNILVAAGQLGSLYNQNNIGNCNMSLQDKIIGATSVLYNLPLITADIGDFPPPFFNTILNKNLKYKDRNAERIVPIAVLFPNHEFINYCFNNRK